MKKLLIVGDAGCTTGFARATHKIADYLHNNGLFDVRILGLNFFGDPTVQRSYPYDIHPCNYPDPYGVKQIDDLVRTHEIDLVLVQNDPWNIPAYLKRVKTCPVVGIVSIDALNTQSHRLSAKTALGQPLDYAPLAKAIFWTEFAQNEAKLSGYEGPSTVIPLGVDTSIYQPMDRDYCRVKMIPGVPPDAFIVGCVNRNQPRKRLDLTISFFSQWVRDYGIKDAYLYIHTCPTGDHSWDLEQLMHYYGHVGPNKRLVLVETNPQQGMPERQLVGTYNCFDVQTSQSQSEGMGLPTLEGMACAIPQHLPGHSALDDWARPAAHMVRCSEIVVLDRRINTIGQVPDRAESIAGFQKLYSDSAYRQTLSDRSLVLANEDRFNWDNIGARYAEALADIV